MGSKYDHGYAQELVAQGEAILAQDTETKSVGVIVEEFLAFLRLHNIPYEIDELHSDKILCHPRTAVYIYSGSADIQIYPDFECRARERRGTEAACS